MGITLRKQQKRVKREKQLKQNSGSSWSSARVFVLLITLGRKREYTIFTRRRLPLL